MYFLTLLGCNLFELMGQDHGKKHWDQVSSERQWMISQRESLTSRAVKARDCRTYISKHSEGFAIHYVGRGGVCKDTKQPKESTQYRRQEICTSDFFFKLAMQILTNLPLFNCREKGSYVLVQG
jgi:hypothetical protein